MTPATIRNLIGLCGLLAIGVGLGAYDWRLGISGVGVILLTLAIIGTFHAERSARS